MAKKYVIKSFKPGSVNHKHTNPLIDLTALGISTNSDIMKTSLGLSASQTQMGPMQDQYYPNMYDATGMNQFAKYRDLTKNQTNNYAFYDMTYQQRRQFCQQIARDNEINFLLDTICNEAIVQDENGYIAQLDLDRLKLFLNKGYNRKQGKDNSNADTLIRDCKVSYNTIYSALGWDDNNGGFQYFKKFLIEGFITLEILIDQATKTVTGFLELDPITLQPDIVTTEDGRQLFIWYQFKGEARQRIIPDSNLIYVSWNSRTSSRTNNISYVESLTRAYNMLKQLENSQLIWNTTNAQRRMKITVPVGNLTPMKAQERINEIIADYDEEVTMDDMSGQVLVNGEPKFNFQRTFVFEDRDGKAVSLEGVETSGYEMTTESLQYFWRKFILESQVPANRFIMNPTSAPSNQMLGDANVTREEYAFGRFIQRIHSMFKEILLKPLWVQVCLKHPELAQTNYLKQGLGIKFNEENIFTLAKKRTLVSEGASTISTLMGIQGQDGKPYFSVDYLIKEYLGMTDQDLEINRKYKEAEIIKNIEMAKLIKKHQADAAVTPVPGQPGADAGGFGGMTDAGGFGGPVGGDIMGGGEFGGPDMGGADDAGGFGAEPAAPEPAAPDAGGVDEGGF